MPFNLAERDWINPVDKIFFPVEAQPLSELTGMDTPKTAIVRTDTNAILGIHGAKYKLITNESLFPPLELALASSDLFSTEDMTISDTIFDNGAKVIRTYKLPKHQDKICERPREPELDDIVNLELRAINSYDGTFPFGVILRANRLACLNGMTVGIDGAPTKFMKHTTYADPVMFTKTFSDLARAYTKQIQEWKAWSKIMITKGVAQKLIREFTTSKRLISHLFRELPQIPIEERAYRYSPEYYPELSLWEFYNMLTSWMTHAQ